MHDDEFRIKWAGSECERAQARALRRAVFCAEQGVFVGDDADAIDAHAIDHGAQTLVALRIGDGGMPGDVVGTVRIHREIGAAAGASAVWWGSRLAVAEAWRSHGRIGATLIRLAVGSAHALGCEVFLAHVQAQNVAMFEKLHWRVRQAEMLHGRPHQLMQADLAHYPPCDEPLIGLVTRSSRRAEARADA